MESKLTAFPRSRQPPFSRANPNMTEIAAAEGIVIRKRRVSTISALVFAQAWEPSRRTFRRHAILTGFLHREMVNGRITWESGRYARYRLKCPNKLANTPSVCFSPIKTQAPVRGISDGGDFGEPHLHHAGFMRFGTEAKAMRAEDLLPSGSPSSEMI